MTGNTANVLIISCIREIVGKLAGKILNVLALYRVGIWWVHCAFPCSVFAVYWVRTSGLVPSEIKLDRFKFSNPNDGLAVLDRS